MKKLVLCLSILFIWIQCHSVVYGSALMDKYSMRITIVADDVIHEWEYDSPDKYEYEKGEKVIKGEQGKKEVIKMVRALKLREDIQLEELLTNLKESTSFKEIERLDVRMINGDGKLFTWVWDDTK